MRILAIETATEACSTALFDNGTLLDARHEVLGRGHAERLVPMIAELPGKGCAGEIRVSLGPGSFTGVRIGLAVARALGIAWHAQVRGYPTLALVAAIARGEAGGKWPVFGTSPPVGLCPATPQKAAGIRIDPPTSDPMPRATAPVATRAPSPPDEPPDVRARSQGLRVRPQMVL